MAVSSAQILSEIPLAYQQTAAEISAGVTPTNYGYPPGHMFRYCTATQISNIQNNVVQDVSSPIQNAINCTTGDVFFPIGFYYIGKPLYITSSSAQNLRFVGESRTNTYIQPNAASIADSNGINALIINQKANGKFSLKHIRLSSQAAAYTGICISAVLNGLASQQPIFSGSIDDCWFDTGSTNSGFFNGFLSNVTVTNCTWEFQKGIFSFPNGSSNVQFSNCTLSNCYDYFVQTAYDGTHNTNVMSVESLQVYTHNRGMLFNLTGDYAWSINDVLLQAAVSNLGSIGIGSFTNCTDIQLSQLSAVVSSTLGNGAIATALAFSGTSANVSDSIFDGANIGISVAGSSAVRLSFDHVDIINTTSNAFDVPGGASPSGLVQVSDCNWSDCQATNILFTAAASFDFLLDHCRLMNAGLGGVAGNRNLNIATSGLLRLSDCIIGQNNGSAAAAYYIDCSGSGQSVLINPTFLGTPPTGIQNPSASQQVTIGWLEVPYSASITFSAAIDDHFDIVATNGTAFTINAPTSPCYGKRITVRIVNSSGGSLGAVTWNAVFHMSAWTSPANGFSRAIDFRYNGSAWIQVTETGVDVPN